MPKWTLVQSWKDQEVFVVGGGESLKGFDWDLLKSVRTIGCNDAYLHGTDICFFGDKKWFTHHESQLRMYQGLVFTHCPQLHKSKLPWLWQIGRESRGINDSSIAWNYNTGAGAISLAVLLGAVKIYLLGFDMKLSKDGKSNWHANKLNKPNKDVYPKFLKGFGWLAKGLKEKHPDVEVINITDDSALEEFPKIGVKEFWSNR